MKTIVDNNYFSLVLIERKEDTSICKFITKPAFEQYRGKGDVPNEQFLIRSVQMPQFSLDTLQFYCPGANTKYDESPISILNWVIDALISGKSIVREQSNLGYFFDEGGRQETILCKESAVYMICPKMFSTVWVSVFKPYELPKWTGARVIESKDNKVLVKFTDTNPEKVGWVLLYFRLLLNENFYSLTEAQKEYFYNPDLSFIGMRKMSCTDNWVRYLKKHF